MRWQEKIRNFWHELYYFRAGKRRIDLGMRCREVAERIDMDHPTSSVIDDLRFRLHMSFCQGCVNYNKTSVALKDAINRAARKESDVPDLEELNRKLIERYRR